MDETSIIEYINNTFDGVDAATSSGDTFFIYDPERNLEANRRFPFATLVTGDNYDAVSNLSRPGVYRLNIGIGKETFRSLFPKGDETAYDYAALDTVMPHPTYGKMYWVSVLNPSEATFPTIQSYLAEAYEISVKRANKAGSSGEGW